MGAEAQFGQYQTPKGLLNLIIFNYPTPSMAREQAAEFQKIPGRRHQANRAAGGRHPQSARSGRRRADPRENQLPGQRDAERDRLRRVEVKGLAKMILNIFVLAGIVLGMCVVGGVGLRRLPDYVAKNVAERRDAGR